MAKSRNRQMTMYRFLCCLVLLAISACTSNKPVVTRATETAQLPTQTLTPAPTATPTSTATPTLTPTAEPILAIDAPMTIDGVTFTFTQMEFTNTTHLGKNDFQAGPPLNTLIIVSGTCSGSVSSMTNWGAYLEWTMPDGAKSGSWVWLIIPNKSMGTFKMIFGSDKSGTDFTVYIQHNDGIPLAKLPRIP